MNGYSQTSTYTGFGGNTSWSNSANWIGGVPSESSTIVILPNTTVDYDAGGNFDFIGSSFTVNGTLNMGTSHLHIKSSANLSISSTATFTGKEIKLESNSTGSIESGAAVTVEELETKGSAVLDIDADIDVTSEIKNEGGSEITGDGSINFTGSNYTNSGGGGIFTCTSNVQNNCFGGGSGSTTITFDGGGDGVNWSDEDNWDGDELPDPENEGVTIPYGFSVTYDVGGNLEFENSAVFSVCGSIDLGGSHLHMKDNSSISICSTGEFEGHEIKLEDNATGLISSGASVTLEKLESKNSSLFTINNSCVNVSTELKNKDDGTIAGSGCVDFTGASNKFTNSGSGGIFGCFEAVYANCVGGLGVLPVELLEFNSKVINNEVILNWSTGSELNNSHFEIWVASDESKFVKINEVKGKGNTLDLQKYSSGFHPKSEGVLYIKLRQVDFDGKYTDSEIISVIYFQSMNFEAVELYPNPANNIISFRNLRLDNAYSVEIYSTHGSLVVNKAISISDDSIGIESLLPGSYLVRLYDQSGSIVTTLKFMK